MQCQAEWLAQSDRQSARGRARLHQIVQSAPCGGQGEPSAARVVGEPQELALPRRKTPQPEATFSWLAYLCYCAEMEIGDYFLLFALAMLALGAFLADREDVRMGRRKRIWPKADTPKR